MTQVFSQEIPAKLQFRLPSTQEAWSLDSEGLRHIDLFVGTNIYLNAAHPTHQSLKDFLHELDHQDLLASAMLH